MIRAAAGLCLAVLVCFLWSGEVARAQFGIHIVSARYGIPNLSNNVTDEMQRRCEGRTVCEGLLKDMFPDIAAGQVKTLSVSYGCGMVQATVDIKDGLTWRVTCPPTQQPSCRADYRIVRERTCDREEQTPEDLKLPSGYRYCWHKKTEYTTKNAVSNASVIYDSQGQPDGLRITWRTTPDCSVLLGTGRASMDHLWTIVGALPGESCPPQ